MEIFIEYFYMICDEEKWAYGNIYWIFLYDLRRREV